MGRPQPLISSAKSDTAMSFPGNIADEYHMIFTFVRYTRTRGSRNATYDRVGGSIFLPLPQELNETYSIQQGARDLGLLGNITGGIQLGARALSEGFETFRSAFKETQSGKSQVEVLQSIGMSSAEFGKYLMLMTPQLFQDTALLDATSQFFGMIKNPHTALIFDGVNLRSHAFNWTFSPRNERESRTLFSIINRFKRHSHPTFTPELGTMALDYPDYVYVNFNKSEFLYPIKRSAITNITVNNSAGGGGPAFYKSGAPVSIQLGVQLTETEILTREDFGDTVTDDGTYASATTPGVNINADQAAQTDFPTPSGRREDDR